MSHEIDLQKAMSELVAARGDGNRAEKALLAAVTDMTNALDYIWEATDALIRELERGQTNMSHEMGDK